MATLFDFFLRRGKPQPPLPPPKGEPVGEQLVAGVDEALGTFDVPGELVENLKKDFKDAFDVKGTHRPGYEPGAVSRTTLSLVDAITDPVKTVRKTVASVFENRSRPSVPLLWDDAESAVWNHFFRNAWVDAQGYGVLPRSVEDAVLRWNEGARRRVVRLAREEKGIFENPGLTLMMAEQLFKAGVTHVEGVGLTTVVADARAAEREVSGCLIDADLALKAGDRKGAEELWGKAGKRQGKWAEKESIVYRDAVRKEFERQSRLGSRKNAPPAAYKLANSQEAKFWRYWKNRRLYFQTLNFLTTYRDEGFGGVFKGYVWKEFTKHAFAEGTWREYLYPPNVIAKLQAKTIGRVLQPVLKGITDAKALFARTWKRFIKDPLTKGIELIRDKIVRKIAGWVAMKLGITGLGAALGSVLPGAGTALGAIISAIGSFLVETAISKMGGVWKVGLFAVVGGLALVFTALFTLGLGFIGLVTLIFNTNAILPAAVTAVPIAVTKEACEPAPSCDEFHYPLQIAKDGLIHRIRWRITITNTGDENETVGFSDSYCRPTGDPSATPITIGAGEEKYVYCTQNITASDDEVIINTVKGATIPGNVPFSGVGAVIVGEPDTAYPIGWPLANGCITQGPKAPFSHTGEESIDINANNAGNPVLATHSGAVVRHCYSLTGCTGGYGNYIRVRSSAGFETVYAHMTDIYVKTGDPVFYGQPVGTVGNTGFSTGFHLHYQFIGLEMAPPYIPREVPPCVGRGACGICW